MLSYRLNDTITYIITQFVDSPTHFLNYGNKLYALDVKDYI